VVAERGFDVDAPLALAADPVAQWLDWEERANLIGFRTSTHPVAVEVASIPRSAVEVHVLPHAPAECVELFLRGDRVMWARHPLNQDRSVAWFDAPVAELWDARFTSSRTLALPGPESGHHLVSLKLATDHPHPDFHQPEKTQLRQEAQDAIRWMQVLARIDGLIGPLEAPLLVREFLVVLVRGGESGFMVRDLALFQDGHHYLPVLSLPWVGRQIARRHGQPFEQFWGRHFAAELGRAKARLLARYGLWYETPNPQNVLIQLDPELRPTGRLVFRDLGDGECATDALVCTDVPWSRFTGELRPETANSFWAFDESGDHSVERATLLGWHAEHDRAYAAELARWFPALDAPAGRDPARWLAHWNDALRGPAAPAAIAAAFAQA